MDFGEWFGSGSRSFLVLEVFRTVRANGMVKPDQVNSLKSFGFEETRLFVNV